MNSKLQTIFDSHWSISQTSRNDSPLRYHAQLRNFAGQSVVIKCGGSVLNDRQNIYSMAQQSFALAQAGVRVAIVHGGGQHINAALLKAGIETVKVEGLRITDENTLPVVIDVLEAINKELVQSLADCHATAIGFYPPDMSVLQAKRLTLKNNTLDIGFVGEIEKVDSKTLNSIWQNYFIPVIAPLGKDLSGNVYNINADHAACAVASALLCDHLIFLTDVPGVLADVLDASSRLSEILASTIPQYIDSGIVGGGMLPKLKSCLFAFEKGVKNIAILNGEQEQSILRALLHPSEFGTLIKGDLK